MSGMGRGRGEVKGDDSPPRKKSVVRSVLDPSVVASEDSSSSRDSGERTIRGRAGYRQQELTTIPPEITNTRSVTNLGAEAWFYANFVQIQPMDQKDIYKYRIDFEPAVESTSLRGKLFEQAANCVFGQGKDPKFDGYSEARVSFGTQREDNSALVSDPSDSSRQYKVKIKRVGTVQWGSFEMLRVYNIHMKRFLKDMGFFCVGNAGAYVHNETKTPVGTAGQLAIIRGYRTSTSIHEEGKICMNLEPCHKIMQKQNVLQYMSSIRDQVVRDRGDLQSALRTAMVGKLVVTGHNKAVYRVEDIDFNMNPKSKFKLNRTGEEIEFARYYSSVHNTHIKDEKQPLLVAVNNNKRREQREATEGQDYSVKLVPELCNIAGLTDRQRTDNRLKMDMIRACQVAPDDRVKHMLSFITSLRNNAKVRTTLQTWGYEYEEHPVRVKGRIFPPVPIGIGRSLSGGKDRWPKTNPEGSFDSIVCRETINNAPPLSSCHVLISRASEQHRSQLFSKLQSGMNRIGLNCQNLIPVPVLGDAANHFVAVLRQLPADCKAVIIILPNQDKEKYDAVKKYCSIEKGLISQVVTTRLLTDDRKSAGAVTKIGIQIAAKLGGEPWRLSIPMRDTMICGYDTYHDTSQRGRSYGAFVASVNDRYSQFWSKADRHDKLDELSTQLANNVGEAMKAFKRIHTTKNWPKRIIIYRDGVSDGQIEHVFKVELESVKQKIKQLSHDVNLSFVIVNKRIGARFYMKKGDTFINPSVGCVVDHTVTRNSRFDFYLVSQHTRQGTVTPTYYNIIFETSGLNAEKHQILAHSLCFLYYNWTGGVRVPALCQYAHKLAYLCGEHLHATPNARLDDRLHFL